MLPREVSGSRTPRSRDDLRRISYEPQQRRRSASRCRPRMISASLLTEPCTRLVLLLLPFSNSAMHFRLLVFATSFGTLSFLSFSICIYIINHSMIVPSSPSFLNFHVPSIHPHPLSIMKNIHYYKIKFSFRKRAKKKKK